MLDSTKFSGILLWFIDLSYFDFPFLVKYNVIFTAQQVISEFLLSSLLVVIQFYFVTSNCLHLPIRLCLDSYLTSRFARVCVFRAYTSCHRTERFITNIHFVTETTQYISLFPLSSKPCTKCLRYKCNCDCCDSTMEPPSSAAS